MNVEAKYDCLRERISSYGKVAIAYSGGFDSTFLLKVCHDVLGDNAIAISVRTDLQPKREYEGSSEFIQKEGINHHIIEFNDYSMACFVENPPERCYYCKTEILTRIIRLANGMGFMTIADGSNVDDIGDYRPGRRAAAELNVESPLIEASMTKSDMRILAQKLGLHNWDKLSPACLASRFPYGTAITPERVSMVNAAEQVLLDMGFNQFRVRYHNEVARIEVLNDEIKRFFNVEVMHNVAERIREVGFLYVSLDMGGYKMGSMNINIEEVANG